jgi:hypothetical protein
MHDYWWGPSLSGRRLYPAGWTALTGLEEGVLHQGPLAVNATLAANFPGSADAQDACLNGLYLSSTQAASLAPCDAMAASLNVVPSEGYLGVTEPCFAAELPSAHAVEGLLPGGGSGHGSAIVSSW